jgi:hypothetical protein
MHLQPVQLSALQLMLKPPTGLPKASWLHALQHKLQTRVLWTAMVDL